MKRLNILTISIIAIFLLNSSTCTKNDNCGHSHKFSIPFSLSPANDSFLIGDTIWIAAEFSDELLDSNDNKKYKLEDIDFFTDFAFSKIDVSPFIDADDKFQTIQLLGQLEFVPLSITPSTSILAVDYLYEKNTYKVKFGFIPREVGLFTIGIASSHTLGFEGKIDIPPCKNEPVEFTYVMNNITDNNFEFITLSPDSLVLTLTKDIFDNHGYYCFFVTE